MRTGTGLYVPDAPTILSRGPGGGGGSSPSLPGTPDLLYEPDGLVGEDGVAATSWNNSGSANAALSPGPNGAGIYRATGGPNGGPCLDLTTGWQGMVNASVAHNYDGSDFSLFIVLKYAPSKFTGTTKRHPFMIYDGLGVTRLQVTSNAGGATDMAIRTSSTVDGGATMSTGWNVRGFVKNQTAGQVTPYIDGVQQSNSALADISTSSPSYVTVGAYLTTLAPWLGEIAWVGFWPVALTDEQCGEVTTYLNSLFGFTHGA